VYEGRLHHSRPTDGRGTGGRGRLALFVVAGLFCACQPEPALTRIDVAAYDDAGRLHRHYTDFRRAAYRLAPGGLVELVLQTERPSALDPTQTIRQVLLIQAFWNPQPGRSFVESSQIDARVRFAMLTPPTGVRYDGSAMVTWRVDRASRRLTGWIESGSLTPRFRMGDAVEPFGAANFTGSFIADENPGEVVETIQMLESRFNRPILAKE